jgi:ornithine cyclodeaminase
LCRDLAANGTVVLDTPDAVHEAGDLLQAGLDVSAFPTLRDLVLGRAMRREGPVLFKSCGWAGWDLAAARCAVPPQAARP